MSHLRNLAAHTAPSGQYPPFISINEVDGGVSFYVREPPRLPQESGEVPFVTEGPKAAVVVSRSVAKRLLREALIKLSEPR